jgi:aryl-alcohol dehydrogenase-like predicted oxidoreductase
VTAQNLAAQSVRRVADEDELVREGLIRHVGVSNYTARQIDEFATVLPVETVQPPYHLFRRDAETDVLPYAVAHGIGVLAYGPLAHGLLGGAASPTFR